MEELTNELDKLIAEEESAITPQQVASPDSDLSKRLREEEAKKKHWREKAVDPTTGKTYKALYEEATKKPEPQTDGLAEVKEELTSFKLAQSGLDEEAIGFVKAYAKGVGKDPVAVLTDGPIKSFLDSRKQKQALENAIPAPSGRTIAVQGKTLAEMTPAERKANWNQIVQTAIKKQ